MGCCCSSNPRPHPHRDPNPATPPPPQEVELVTISTQNTDFDDVFAECEDLKDDSGDDDPHQTKTPTQSPTHKFRPEAAHQDDDDFGEIEDSAMLVEMHSSGSHSSKASRLREIQTLREQIEKHGRSLLDKRLLVQELAQIIYAKTRQCDAAFSNNILDHGAYLTVLGAIEDCRQMFESYIRPNPDLLTMARSEMFAVVQVVPLSAAAQFNLGSRSRPLVSRAVRLDCLGDNESPLASTRSRNISLSSQGGPPNTARSRGVSASGASQPLTSPEKKDSDSNLMITDEPESPMIGSTSFQSPGPLNSTPSQRRMLVFG